MAEPSGFALRRLTNGRDMALGHGPESLPQQNDAAHPGSAGWEQWRG